MASYRIVSSEQHQLTKQEHAALAFCKERFGRPPRDDYGPKFKQLAATYAAERNQILPADKARKIREAVEAAAAYRPTVGRRYTSLAECKRQGVDLEKLREAQQHLYRGVRALSERGGGFSSSEVTTPSRVAPDGWHLNVLPPGMDGAQVFVPPFGEPWERWEASGADGDGRVTENASYVEAEFGVLGAKLAAENRDAGDFNHIDVARGNGFFVPYVMPSTGLLQINAELICLQCVHHARTWDEWGWSEIDCNTTSNFAVSAFWGHDDPQPVSQDLTQTLAAGLNVSDDGESYPGTKVQVAPGEPRSVTFYTDVAFPAGKTVWIYAGVSNQILAALNDVSIEAWVDSRWQLASLTVTTL